VEAALWVRVPPAPHLDAHHEAGLLRAVKACLIHNTLLLPPKIEIQLKSKTLAAH